MKCIITWQPRTNCSSFVVDSQRIASAIRCFFRFAQHGHNLNGDPKLLGSEKAIEKPKGVHREVESELYKSQTENTSAGWNLFHSAEVFLYGFDEIKSDIGFSHIKAEQHDVAVFYHIVFAFHTNQPFFFGCGVGAGCI